ncbi:hypothetical protein QRQ56_23325 [Bradyrhizobium sp. U531]|uniref:hypothetical protein n=1 Tax=Bradyrhizobium sp. U531 TaxID=3053458 RepID=UPI003F424B88
MDYRQLLKKYLAFVAQKNGGTPIMPRDVEPPFDRRDVYELIILDEEALDEARRPPLNTV